MQISETRTLEKGIEVGIRIEFFICKTKPAAFTILSKRASIGMSKDKRGTAMARSSAQALVIPSLPSGSRLSVCLRNASNRGSNAIAKIEAESGQP